MSVIHTSLLAGLVLLGLPLLLHLIMRQKPKPIRFPAFRFLKQKQQTNRRRLRLQQLLLLGLRMLVIAALVFALARPRLLGNLLPDWMLGSLGFGQGRTAAAVLILDTSFSMQWRIDGKTRLDEARRQARALLQTLARDSRVLILETGEEADEDWLAPNQAEVRLDQLRLRPVLVPLEKLIDRGVRLLRAGEQNEDAPLPLLYVFSDRTIASWNADAAGSLGDLSDIGPVYVDLGKDEPANVGITRVEVEPPVVAPGANVKVTVHLRAQGREFVVWPSCQFEGNASDVLPLRQRIKVEPKKTPDEPDAEVVFTLQAPAKAVAGTEIFEAPGQVVVRLTEEDRKPFYGDDLACDNTGQATFLVRDDPRRNDRRLLTIVDTPGSDWIWSAAQRVLWRTRRDRSFENEIRTVEAVNPMPMTELNRYGVVCLFQVKQPSAELWKKLRNYVEEGGGLLIVPPGEETAAEGFNRGGDQAGVLPARLEGLTTLDRGQAGARWAGYTGGHPIMLALQEMVTTSRPDFEIAERRPFARRYWRVRPNPGARGVVTYEDKGADGQAPAALVEKSLGQGIVLQLTVTLDGQVFEGDRDWHNYVKDSSFGMVLISLLTSYLGGDVQPEELNFTAGQLVSVALPRQGKVRPSYLLDGPVNELSDSERVVMVPPEEVGQARNVAVPQAREPGNYRLIADRASAVTGFSVSLPARETNLERVPVEAVEKALGAGSLKQAGPELDLKKTLEGKKPPQVELLPLLLVVVLLVLSFEPLLANQYYRRQRPVGAGAGEGKPA